ncbi:hypothetical protein GPLA_3605 [Paraglaciecola polaris LMG 21857]|uniref:Uncharacterized protein n=1 Tax=Paraglaciecola polaris LMG 21857 TaxID=1129793 RepID=K7A0L0_9ALTE|nr:hypothetical protein GPLA_3605 [Paraglaciecola polaris LMG 21857]
MLSPEIKTLKRAISATKKERKYATVQLQPKCPKDTFC